VQRARAAEDDEGEFAGVVAPADRYQPNSVDQCSQRLFTLPIHGSNHDGNMARGTLLTWPAAYNVGGNCGTSVKVVSGGVYQIAAPWFCGGKKVKLK